MINNIKEFDKERLLLWLKYEAGVNHPTWFGDNLKYGGLEIQQIPEEYIEYLWFLKENSFDKYLNIGIGKGGSFLIETYIQSKLKKSVAVDNSSYWGVDQKESIKEKIKWLKENTNTTIQFYDSDSSEWLKNCKEKFNVIFIDGDHSYEGVRNDYINALPLLNKKNGYIVFHDINSDQCPGVVRLWNEIKNQNCLEFIKSNKCGIGIWRY